MKKQKAVEENTVINLTEQLSEAVSVGIETRISMAIRPKPKYLPTFIWHSLLKRFLVIDIVNKFK